MKKITVHGMLYAESVFPTMQANMTMTIESDITEQLSILGTRIRATREFQQLTQTKVSDLAGIGLQTYLRIEDGHAGVGALNLGKVLRVLGMDASMLPATLPAAPETALHALHLDSERVDQAVEEAVKLACESLDEFLGVTYPERDGIGSNFQGLLKEHVAAMLCGEHSAKQRYATQLPRLVYSDKSVGGPQWSNEVKNHGWVLRVRGTQKVLHESRTVNITHPDLDPWSSRDYALDAFRKFIEREGHPPGPVDAVPVYLGNDEKYGFSPPTMQRTPILNDSADLKLKQLFEHIAEQVRLDLLQRSKAVEALTAVYAAIESGDTEELSTWLDTGVQRVGSGFWTQPTHATPLGAADAENLAAFLGHAVGALRDEQVTASAFAGAMHQMFGALDDGNRGELQNWLRQGRMLLALAK